MILCREVQRYTGLDFSSYVALPGYSHSFLKREINGTAPHIQKTDKMAFGSLVDDIRSNAQVDMGHPLYPAARDIAARLYAEFGTLLDAFHKQVSYTGTFSHRGFSMPVKGRPDFEVPNKLIVDLKVTHAKDLRGLLAWAKYDDQQFCYGKLAGVTVRYLMIYMVPHKRTEFIPLRDTPSNSFWEEKILKFGTVAPARIELAPSDS